MSHLADAVRQLDKLSSDELRQLEALIAVRLGKSASKARVLTKGGKGDASEKNNQSSSKAGKGKPQKKGNPTRKSQYATHPTYRAYKIAQKAMAKHCADNKVLFKDVTGEIRDAYDSALAHWVGAKSGFRAKSTEPEAGAPGTEEDSESPIVPEAMDETKEAEPHETQIVVDRRGKAPREDGRSQAEIDHHFAQLLHEVGRVEVPANGMVKYEGKTYALADIAFGASLKEWHSLGKKARKSYKRARLASDDERSE
jgi:hypothetical protein